MASNAVPTLEFEHDPMGLTTKATWCMSMSYNMHMKTSPTGLTCNGIKNHAMVLKTRLLYEDMNQPKWLDLFPNMHAISLIGLKKLCQHEHQQKVMAKHVRMYK